MNDNAGTNLWDAEEKVNWFDINWMWVSAVLGLINFIFLFTYLHQSRCFQHKMFLKNFSIQHWYGFLLSSVYSLHQLEEHGYDIYGRRYMFVPIFNKSIEGLLGIAVSVRSTTMINMINIWICFPVCTILSNQKNMFLPAAISWGTAIINGLVGHLLPVLKGEYIPGALQSAFMVPLGIYLLARVYGRDGLIYRSWIVRFVIPLGAGIIFHLVALIAPVKLSTEESEDYIVPIFQILGGILIPLLITYVTKKILNFKSQIYLLANS